MTWHAVEMLVAATPWCQCQCQISTLAAYQSRTLFHACAMQIADNDKNLGMICLSEQGSMASAGDSESLLPFSQGGAGPSR